MKKHKIKFKGLMGGSHSWAVVNRSLSRAAIISENKVSISSFNGYNCYTLQNNYIHNYIDKFIGKLDYIISYTNPHNYRNVFSDTYGKKLAISNYESNILPSHWSSCQGFCDEVIVNSNYSYNNFSSCGFDESCMRVVPLGTDIARSEPAFQNDRFNFLNVSSPHSRKNIDQVLRCYYKAFSAKDLVMLTIKTSKPDKISHFNIDVFNIIREVQESLSFSEFPDVQVIVDDVDDMSGIYSSCDALVSCSSSEGFGLPMLEARCLGLEVIAPNYSGHTDFLNRDNSILVDAIEFSLPKEYQYWHFSKDAVGAKVSDDDVVSSMRVIYNGYRSENTIDGSEYSWDNILEKVIGYDEKNEGGKP